MSDRIEVRDTREIPDNQRMVGDRPDYTIEQIDVDVTVAAERLAAVIRSSAELIQAGVDNQYSTGWLATGDFHRLIGFVKSDVNCTIYLEESLDGEAASPDTQTTQAYTANATDGRFSFELTAPYVRLRIVAAVDTTTFRIWSRLSAGA